MKGFNFQLDYIRTTQMIVISSCWFIYLCVRNNPYEKKKLEFIKRILNGFET